MACLFFVNRQNFFQGDFPFYTPSVVYEHFSCYTSLPTLSIISLLNIHKFNEYILFSMVLSSPQWLIMLNIFLYIYSPFVHLLLYVSVQIIELIVFLLLSCKSYLWIQDTAFTRCLLCEYCLSLRVLSTDTMKPL